MNKWLKRNKKWLMVVGGTFLMVSFLLPQTINQLAGDPAKMVIATLDGVKIRGKEYHEYQRQYDALRAFPFTESIFKGLGVENFEHYLLLVKSAERMGVIGGESDGVAFLNEEIAPGAGAQEVANADMTSGDPARAERARKAMLGDKQVRDEYVEVARKTLVPALSRAAMGRSGFTEQQWNLTLATFKGVLRMLEEYQQSARVSDKRALRQASKLAESASIDYAVVSADRVAEKVAAPTDAEMAAHYEKYKLVESGSGENGIGYRMPNRVKVEWIQLNKANVAVAIRLNDAHVRERWNQRNKGGTQEQFEASRVEFEKSLRNEYAEDILRIADTRFREIASEANRKFQLEGRWRVVPANWREGAMTLDAMAKAIEAAVKTETSAPDDRERWQSPVDISGSSVVKAETAWQSEADLSKLDGIGQATLQRGNEKTPLGTLLLSVREFKADTSFPLQVGVFPVFDRSLRDANGNYYYFRVTATRPAGEPEGLDEVRAKVFADLKKLAGYKMLVADMDGTLQTAATAGLAAVVSKYPVATNLDPAMSLPTLPVEIRRDVRVSRNRAQAFGNPELDVPEFRDAVMNKTQSLDPRTLASSQPGPMRTLAVALPKALSVVFARVEYSEPLTHEFLRSADRGIAGQLISEELPKRDFKRGFLAGTPYAFEPMKKRLNYVPTRSREDEKKDEKK